MKYLKLVDGLKSNANGFEYKIGEVNVADTWNPTTFDPALMGGFNFSVEKKSTASAYNIDGFACDESLNIVDGNCNQTNSGFVGVPGDMRSDKRILARQQRIVGSRRFLGEDVGTEGRNPIFAQGICHILIVNQWSATSIDDYGRGFHQP